MLRSTLLLAAVFLSAVPAYGAPTPRSQAEIQSGRQQRAAMLLTTDMPATARYMRGSCAQHDMQAHVAQARAAGDVLMPDAGATCLAGMIRQAHDGALAALYQDILDGEMGEGSGAANRGELAHQVQGLLDALGSGVSATARALPERIAQTIQSGSDQVDLGSGHLLSVTPGLALDVGFTAAYVEGPAARPMRVSDQARLTAAVENCVGQHGDNRVCFTAGYVEGAAAYSAAQRSAAQTRVP